MKMGWDNAPGLIDVLTILLFVIIVFALTSAAGKFEEALLDYKQRLHRFVNI